MHRPTRQHKALLEKIDEKKAKSRKSGNKAKRLKKWAETYKALTQGASSDSPSADA